MTDAFTYAELDEILRGSGRSGAIGMSAIDGLIAALVAAPSFVHPDEWVPLVFGGHQPPLDENSPELRVVTTIFNRYNEVSDILADRPQAYRPIFMVDADGSIVVREWAVGFALGIGLRAKFKPCVDVSSKRRADSDNRERQGCCLVSRRCEEMWAGDDGTREDAQRDRRTGPSLGARFI
jgi:yecA family protein